MSIYLRMTLRALSIHTLDAGSVESPVGAGPEGDCAALLSAPAAVGGSEEGGCSESLAGDSTGALDIVTAGRHGISPSSSAGGVKVATSCLKGVDTARPPFEDRVCSQGREGQPGESCVEPNAKEMESVSGSSLTQVRSGTAGSGMAPSSSTCKAKLPNRSG